MTQQKIQQLAVITIVSIWGAISFIILCGEDANGTMSLGEFFTWKALALASLYGCGKFVKAMERRGLIPRIKE